MAQVVKKKTSEENENDVAKSLRFSRGSGLDESDPEEEIVEEEEVDETPEEEIDEEEGTPEDEDEEDEEETEKDEIDYKALYEKSEDEKSKLMDKVLKGDEDKAPKKEPEPIKEVDFISSKDISDEDFDSVVSSKESYVENMNAFGNKVGATVLNEVMDNIPSMVTSIAKFQVELDGLNRDFYKSNPDLVPVKKYVGSIADEMIKENGINDLSDYAKMLKELPTVVRKELDLKSPVKKKGTEEKAPKGGPKVNSQRRGKVSQEEVEKNLSPLQKDINRSLKFMRNR